MRCRRSNPYPRPDQCAVRSGVQAPTRYAAQLQQQEEEGARRREHALEGAQPWGPQMRLGRGGGGGGEPLRDAQVGRGGVRV